MRVWARFAFKAHLKPNNLKTRSVIPHTTSASYPRTDEMIRILSKSLSLSYNEGATF